MQKGFAIIYLLIGVLVLAVLGAVIYFGKLSFKLPFYTPQTPIPLSQKVDETTGWKTVGNNELTFKVPNDWHYLKCTNEESGEIIFVGPKLKRDESAECNFDFFPDLMLVVTEKNHPYKSLEDAVPKPEKINITNSDRTTETFNSVDISNISYLTIDGEQAISWNSVVPFGPGEGEYFDVYVHSKNTLIKLSDVSVKAIFDQILSTFKFTQ